MRAFGVVLVVLLIAALINAVRGDAESPLVRALPLLGGSAGIYDLGSATVILITAWGLRRMFKRDNDG